MNNPNPFEEIKAYVEEWAERTDQALLERLRYYKVGITQDLYNSVRSQVYKKAFSMLQYDLKFLYYGRFRDISTGRGRGKSLFYKLESTATNRQIIENTGKRKIKPAPWYSKTFYARLNALEGVIGLRAMEQLIRNVKQPLENDQEG
jgi:hypothetical protein